MMSQHVVEKVEIKQGELTPRPVDGDRKPLTDESRTHDTYLSREKVPPARNIAVLKA
jgi:hypothetical protein